MRRSAHLNAWKSDIAPDNSPLSEMHLLTVFLSLFLLLSVYFFCSSGQAKAAELAKHTPMSFSCGYDRCYGVNDWNGSNHGAYTQMDVVQLHAGSLIMNNTLWVGSTNFNQWAEGGYKVWSNMGYEFWYWAYSAGGTDYHEYDSGGLHTGTYGDFGHPASVYVWWEDSSHWNVAIYGNATSWLPNGFTLSMSAVLIQIGQEVGGSGFSSDSSASFYSNQYINANDGSYHYQYQDGQPGEFVGANTNPPYSGWNTRPSQSSSGGSWWACSC